MTMNKEIMVQEIHENDLEKVNGGGYYTDAMDIEIDTNYEDTGVILVEFETA